MNTELRWCLLLPGLLFFVGCIKSSPNEVVVYAALDKEFSQPILDDLATETGLTVLTKFDQESNKTVGLVTDIIQNQTNPRTDIFWNNEILHTLRLQKLGLLEVYRSPEADHFPANFVSAKKQWHGFAARARVLIVNTDLIPNVEQRPDSIYDLMDRQWQGKCAMAKPFFGTTASHAAVLYDYLGADDATKLFSAIADNAAIEGGNKQVAVKVARGEYAFGITDTDDAIIEIENGHPVTIVFPDQKDDQMGTLLIPNTLCIIKNGPNTERAKQLVDRLLQPDIEQRLAEGPSAQIPLHDQVTTHSRIEPPGSDLKIMDADFQSAADQWENTTKSLLKIFGS